MPPKGGIFAQGGGKRGKEAQMETCQYVGYFNTRLPDAAFVY